MKGKELLSLTYTIKEINCQGGDEKMQEKKLSPGAQAARREYLRKWRAKNRDKVREARRRYWEKKAVQAEQQNEEDEKNDF